MLPPIIFKKLEMAKDLLFQSLFTPARDSSGGNFQSFG
jgi:hypothetical protein